MLPNEKSLPIIPIDVWNIKFDIQQKKIHKKKKQTDGYICRNVCEMKMIILQQQQPPTYWIPPW